MKFSFKVLLILIVVGTGILYANKVSTNKMNFFSQKNGLWNYEIEMATDVRDVVYDASIGSYTLGTVLGAIAGITFIYTLK